MTAHDEAAGSSAATPDGSSAATPGDSTWTGTGDTRRPLRPDLLRERLVAPAGPVDRLDVVDRAGSTNTDLADAVRTDPLAWDHVVVLVTEHQADGRGRSGRAWQTPPAAALTFSVALSPPGGPQTLGWLPLLAGLAVVRAVRAVSGVPVALKWPNDLMVDVPGAVELEGWGTERKVGGILAELVRTRDEAVADPAVADPAVVDPAVVDPAVVDPAVVENPAVVERATVGEAVVVVGIGVNVSQAAHELPVPSALSLAGAGAVGADALDRDALLIAVVEALTGLVDRWRRAGGDVGAAGLVDEVAAVCTTLGRQVRVELPGDREVAGTAVGLDADGALLVRDAADEVHPVRAGDVRHLRRGGSAR